MTREEFLEIMKPGTPIVCDSCGDSTGHAYRYEGFLYCEMCRTAAEAEDVLLKRGEK